VTRKGASPCFSSSSAVVTDRFYGPSSASPDPAAAADLPPALAGGFDESSHALVARSTNMTATLGELVGWADRHHLDLAGLEIGPPTLEDAYLAAIGEPVTQKMAAHA
jgi:hypothetical protein